MYAIIDNFLRGYKDNEGIMHTEFEYREMTGLDEEAIAKPKIKNNGALITRTILERCIERIGTIKKEDVKPKEWTEIIQSLAIGDQDYALLKIREESLGDELEVTHVCPYCETKIESVFTIDEIPVIPYNGRDTIEFELPKGHRDKNGEIHTEGVLRYPNGLDREVLSKLISENPSVANTYLLTRCITKLGNATITDDLFRSLSIKDRNYLFKLIRENSFGFEIDNLNIECPSCERELAVSFNHTDFL